MTTLALVITDLRNELKDTDSGAYRWTDTELTRHLRRAVVEYSRVSPREMKATIATTNGSRAITISGMSSYDDLIKVLAVEFPVGNVPLTLNRFQLYDGVVTMLGDNVGTGANAYIYWGALHILIDGIGTTCTVPEKDQETVICGGAGYAALAWAAYATNRVNLGGTGTRRDFQDYGIRRLDAFQSDLKRLRSRVRTQRMYIPAKQGTNRLSTDWGP